MVELVAAALVWHRLCASRFCVASSACNATLAQNVVVVVVVVVVANVVVAIVVVDNTQ